MGIITDSISAASHGSRLGALMLRSGAFSRQEEGHHSRRRDIIDKNLKIAREREASDGVQPVSAGSRYLAYAKCYSRDEISLSHFSELQKNEPKSLKTGGRTQNRTPLGKARDCPGPGSSLEEA